MSQRGPFFEDVAVGMEIPPQVKHPTPQQLVQFAGASGDFHPMHYDDAYAKSQGQAGVIVHGMLKCAFLGQLLTDWIRQNGTLRKLSCSFRGVDYPGDAIYCRGKVTDKYIEQGEQFLVCEVWTENQRGEQTTRGTALVAFNSKIQKETAS